MRGRSLHRSPEVVVERPPEGLARGRFEAPRWLIGLLGAAVVLFAVAFLVRRVARARRARA